MESSPFQSSEGEQRCVTFLPKHKMAPLASAETLTFSELDPDSHSALDQNQDESDLVTNPVEFLDPAMLEICDCHSPVQCDSVPHLAGPTREPSNMSMRHNPIPSISQSTWRSDISSVGSVFCRICHEGDSKERLMAPCKCSGTMGLIHQTCIERWLESSNSNKCEICQYVYKTERKCRPFSDWLKMPASPTDRRNLIGDSVCFLVLTPLASVSAWLCISGAIRYTEAIGIDQWESIGLITLSVFLLIMYVVWCTVALRYHVRVYTDWKSTNHIVHVVGIDQKSSSRSSDTGSYVVDAHPSQQQLLAYHTANYSALPMNSLHPSTQQLYSGQVTTAPVYSASPNSVQPYYHGSEAARVHSILGIANEVASFNRETHETSV